MSLYSFSTSTSFLISRLKLHNAILVYFFVLYIMLSVCDKVMHI